MKCHSEVADICLALNTLYSILCDSILGLFIILLVDLYIYWLGNVHDPLAYETISKPIALFLKIHGCQSNS